MSTRLRKVVALVVMLAAVLAVTGCATWPAGPAAAGTVPALSPAEARQAFDGYLTATAAGGPGSYRATTFYLPEGRGYPRFFVAAASAAGGRQAAALVGGVRLPTGSPALLLFEQASAGARWVLASAVRQPPATAAPELAASRDGYVPVLPPSAPGLVAPLGSVGALQAAVVDDGPASAAARAVASGPLTTGMFAAARDHADGLRPPPGDVYRWALDGSGLPLLALRTADGGALAFYAMTLTETVAVPSLIRRDDPVRSGPQIPVPARLRPLLPAGQLPPLVRLRTRQALSFAAVDPPAGHGKVRVIAVGGGRTTASAS